MTVDTTLQRTLIPLAPLIRNAEASLVELQCGDIMVPMIVPDRQPRLPRHLRCWTTCLESMAVGFVMEEWRARTKPGPLHAAVAGACAFVSSRGPWRRAIQLGSLPFSTTLRTVSEEKLMWELLPMLREEMPHRPFAIRHVLGREQPHLPDETLLLPARAVYFHDFSEGPAPRPKNFRRDLNFFRRSELLRLEDRDFTPERIEEGLRLYRQLYHNRYSRRHPDYTVEMVMLARKRGWLRLGGLSDPDDDRLLGFYAIHEAGRVSSAPLLGYDTTLASGLGLYRQLSSMISLDAMQRRQLENASSGAGEFKRRRGFKPVLEYLAVLPPLAGPRRAGDRAILKLLAAATRKITLEDFLAAGG